MAQYKYKFPLDQWGRIGGQYSLADVPVVAHKEMQRECKILKSDDVNRLCEVQDSEKGWIFVVDMADVSDSEFLTE